MYPSFSFKMLKRMVKKKQKCPCSTSEYNYTSIIDIINNRTNRIKSITS